MSHKIDRPFIQLTQSSPLPLKRKAPTNLLRSARPLVCQLSSFQISPASLVSSSTIFLHVPSGVRFLLFPMVSIQGGMWLFLSKGEHRQTIYTFAASPHRPCCRCWCVPVHGENIAKPYTHLQLHLIDHVVDVGAFLSMGRTSPNHVHICSFTSSTMLSMLVRFCPWGEHRQTIYTFVASPHRPCC